MLRGSGYDRSNGRLSRSARCRRCPGSHLIESSLWIVIASVLATFDIKKAVDPLVQRLDHFYLNEIDGLSNPTSEVLARWLWQRIKPTLPLLASIIVHETCTSTCEGPET